MTASRDVRARFIEVHCKPQGHAHGLDETGVCAEILLAKQPGSTGLKFGLFPGTPPALKEFYDGYCKAEKHEHDERSAVLCVDLIYRRSIQRLSQKIGAAKERSTASRRSPGGAY